VVKLRIDALSAAAATRCSRPQPPAPCQPICSRLRRVGGPDPRGGGKRRPRARRCPGPRQSSAACIRRLRLGPSSERREAHQGLAEVSSDPVDRARHRALATTGGGRGRGGRARASAPGHAARAPALGAFLAGSRPVDAADGAGRVPSASPRRGRASDLGREIRRPPATSGQLALETDPGPERAVTLLDLADTVGVTDLARSVGLARTGPAGGR
jgi:hypothetical protein